jgi:hypothetical protein
MFWQVDAEVSKILRTVHRGFPMARKCEASIQRSIGESGVRLPLGRCAGTAFASHKRSGGNANNTANRWPLTGGQVFAKCSPRRTTAILGHPGTSTDARKLLKLQTTQDVQGQGVSFTRRGSPVAGSSPIAPTSQPFEAAQVCKTERLLYLPSFAREVFTQVSPAG